MDAIGWIAPEDTTALGMVLGLLAMRLIPVTSYLAFRALRTRRALVLIASALACAATVWAFAVATPNDIITSAVGFAYYTLLAWVLVSRARQLRLEALRGVTLFVLLCALSLLVPALVFGTGVFVPMLVVGWHFVLASYSYCVDADRGSIDPLSKRQGLFFMLVDPSLVFAKRGRFVDLETPAWSRIAPCLSGLALTAAGALTASAAAPDADAWLELSYPKFVVHAGAMFLAAYWLRAGAAQLQLGMLRLAGVHVASCFDFPFLSSSPTDFWRRWNLYVGNWAQYYVFVPMSLQLARQRRFPLLRRHGGLRQALAVALTFVFMGGYHDVFTYVTTGAVILHYTQAFAVSAAALLVWEGAARLVSLEGLFGRAVSRLIAIHYIIAVVVLASTAPPLLAR